MTCPICLEDKPLTKGHEKHKICSDCYDVKKFNNKCPICRGVLDENIKIYKLTHTILNAFFQEDIVDDIMENPEQFTTTFTSSKERANYIRELRVMIHQVNLR